MIPSKKKTIKEKYLGRYRPFFWSFGNIASKLSENDAPLSQYVANEPK